MLWWLVFVFTGLVASVLAVVTVYQKLTTGICKSSVHMVGKVVIVTGGNSGIGYETSKNLAERGAKVIIACRNEERAKKAVEDIIQETGNKDVHYRILDLSSLKSLRVFCDNILKTEKQLDVLINNAAVLDMEPTKTDDGLNSLMQPNYFSPFLLTCLLLPLLKSSAPSRIINLSSMGHIFARVDFDDLNMEKPGVTKRLAYGNSKLLINLMTLELSRRLKGTGVTVNAVHPGVSGTPIIMGMTKFKFVNRILQHIFNLVYQNSWEAAQTSIYLAVSPEVKDVSGKYFADCKESNPSKLSRDTELARKLWSKTEQILNFTSTKNNVLNK